MGEAYLKVQRQLIELALLPLQLDPRIDDFLQRVDVHFFLFRLGVGGGLQVVGGQCRGLPSRRGGHMVSGGGEGEGERWGSCTGWGRGRRDRTCSSDVAAWAPVAAKPDAAFLLWMLAFSRAIRAADRRWRSALCTNSCCFSVSRASKRCSHSATKEKHVLISG